MKTIIALLILWSTPSFCESYVERSTTYPVFGRLAPILIYEPLNANPSLPLFVWVNGTNCKYDDGVSRRILESFARKGAVAASVDYNNGLLQGHACNEIQGKVRRIFDISSLDSAVNRIVAAVPRTQLSRGILVAGFSQGSNLAALAVTFNPHVRGAWLMATGTILSVLLQFDLSCTAVNQTGLRAVRAVNGIADQPDGGGYLNSADELEANNRRNVQSVTQVCLGCSGVSAIDSSRNGWALVPHTAVEDGKADHFFMYKAPGHPTPDKNWDTTSAEWGRSYNVDWLWEQLD